MSTNNSCGNLCVGHHFVLCGKLCIICVTTYVYDTLLCLWQLMCYMCGNLCVRHLLFSGNFYITSVATLYKIFFRQLMCMTLFLVFVTTPVHNKVWFHGKFLFFLTTYTKNAIFLLQLLLYKCGKLCVDTLTTYMIAYSNLEWVNNIIKIYASEI